MIVFMGIRQEDIMDIIIDMVDMGIMRGLRRIWIERV